MTNSETQNQKKTNRRSGRTSSGGSSQAREAADIKEKFEEYITRDEAEKGVESGTFIKGDIRINSKNFKEAYVSNPDRGKDIAVLGLVDRNRALEGDVVILLIKDEKDWHRNEDGSVQKTAKVVFLWEKMHLRICVGFLKNLEKTYAIFCPRDHRVPRFKISSTSIPMHILQNPEKYKDIILAGQIVTWTEPNLAHGIILSEVGERDCMKSEIEAILLEHGIDSNPVPEELNEYFPSLPFFIPKEEIDRRLDLRKKLIFTIDPETARDLDDALSIEEISESVYSIGVHISDVSYFLQPNTPLDKFVSGRATTVYLIQRAIHMLPQSLCMLASLIPGDDKLAVSVFFTLDSEGNHLDTPRITRSVIHSAAQLSYEVAQAVIDGENPEFPMIYNGYSEEDIKNCILKLNKIAVKLRELSNKRGTLRIKKQRPVIIFDDNSFPIEIKEEMRKESNWLVEEFMLLANVTVAEHLIKYNKKLALLRRHDEPNQLVLDKMEEGFHKLGIFIKTSSTGEIRQSIDEYSSDNLARQLVFYHLILKIMQRAEYFCDSERTHHYALNYDLYTHFTSPIRRYSDIIVHRLLLASLGYTETPSWTTDQVRGWASNCNKKHFNSRQIQGKLPELFAGFLVKRLGSCEKKAVVISVYSYSLEVIIIDFGIVLRAWVQEGKFQLDFKKDGEASSLLVIWDDHHPQLIQVFSEITVLLKCLQDNKLRADLLPPT